MTAHPRPPAASLLAALSLAFASGCGDDGAVRDDFDASLYDPMKPIDELVVGRWNEIRPGGPTTCSRGGEYSFFVYPGAADRIVVSFQGGGACWSATNCRQGPTQTFLDDVAGTRASILAGEFGGGIFDMEEARNPVMGFTHVLVPYCTGDLHAGEASGSYEDVLGEVAVEHRGRVNTLAALSWIEDNFAAPEQVLTTGCSAGGYGAAIWAPHLQRRYRRADHVLLDDAGNGVFTPTFLRTVIDAWAAEAAIPDWLPGFDPTSFTSIEQLIVGYALEAPSSRVAQSTATFDSTQTFFSLIAGSASGAADWSTKMRTITNQQVQGADNFRYFIAGDDASTPGRDESTTHCLTPTADFYEQATDGVTVAEFLGNLLADVDVDNVACSGDTCAVPPQ